ncbi:MAG: glycosyltransferase family 4 protein [Thermodesulfobacteriota bacterium]
MRHSVLFLTNAYPDFDSSYRAVFIRKMAHLLKGRGNEIFVVTPKIYKESHYVENQNGVRVFRFPFLSRNKLLIEYQKVPYGKMILYYISGFFLTLYVILRYQCSLIHVHWAIPIGVIAIFAGVLLRRPFVVTVHGSDLRLATEGSNFLGKIFSWVCKRACHITCVSEVQTKEIEKMGIERAKISTFPMGIDQDFLKEGEFRERKSDGEAFTVISNRNLLPLYNVSLLIRAIPIVLEEEPNTQFLIAGDGSERENLEREAKALNLGSIVRFLGRIPHEKMPGLLAQADIYVSTSLHDGASVSLLEALGSGAFPVVTDIPPNSEWIRDGENGFLFPANDERALARQIINAIRDRGLLEKAAQKNFRAAVETVMWPATIEKTTKIYEKVLSCVNSKLA